ncbi:MAG: FAD-dependent oxidoreductase, partial [Candidatus Omnitrophica bacterium]|nr:FAD-dependent oxidoreductase [Candidatus Omnitrophota bacterium]
WLQTKVNEYDGTTVTLSNGKQIRTKNLIWAAGVTGAVLPGLNPDVVLPNNRLKVNPFNQVEGYDDIYAIGDLAAMITEETPKGHPQLAPVAIAQAKMLAKNLGRTLKNQPLKPFSYKSYGVMATIGRNNAVVDLKFTRFGGRFGWYCWLFIHLMSLVGFRNKVVAFINWAWNYFSYDRGLRLIIRSLDRRSVNYQTIENDRRKSHSGHPSS